MKNSITCTFNNKKEAIYKLEIESADYILKYADITNIYISTINVVEKNNSLSYALVFDFIDENCEEVEMLINIKNSSFIPRLFRYAKKVSEDGFFTEYKSLTDEEFDNLIEKEGWFDAFIVEIDENNIPTLEIYLYSKFYKNYKTFTFKNITLIDINLIYDTLSKFFREVFLSYLNSCNPYIDYFEKLDD